MKSCLLPLILSFAVLPLSAQQFDMELTEYHENGQLGSIGKQRDGKKTGEWKVFYENGQLRYKGNFTEGIEDGAWEGYFENGQL